MSLITHNELVCLVDQGVIEGVDPSHINAASIDLTLGDSMLAEVENEHTGGVNLAGKATPRMLPMLRLSDGGWRLYPGEFALASTREVFNLPNDIAAEFKLKSSLARSGLQHLLAGWCDPGWHGSTLTLELKNVLQHHPLILRPGMKIGQIVLWRGEPVPEEASYAKRGRYNRQTDPQPSKGVE